jgi:hypothetical protein
MLVSLAFWMQAYLRSQDNAPKQSANSEVTAEFGTLESIDEITQSEIVQEQRKVVKSDAEEADADALESALSEIGRVYDESTY